MNRDKEVLNILEQITEDFNRLEFQLRRLGRDSNSQGIKSLQGCQKKYKCFKNSIIEEFK